MNENCAILWDIPCGVIYQDTDSDGQVFRFTIPNSKTGFFESCKDINTKNDYTKKKKEEEFAAGGLI